MMAKRHYEFIKKTNTDIQKDNISPNGKLCCNEIFSNHNSKNQCR